jgi:5-methylcytosine-specific restriction endonuclease McrBC GTP-binding regulatory subunit McrB
LEDQIAALLAQGERLKAEIEELERKRDKAAEDMQHLLDGYMAQGKVVTGAFEFVDAFDSIRTPVLLESKVRRTDMSEEEALDAVRDHASSLGFLYPDRVLRSFHTSLKLGGNSPLLVLAGISGTGKSQLPRLYCDAVGIHFLPMAVQPAWDSPADMLGFFSHIERRFKPTPMARALFQMDKWTLEELKRLKDAKKRKEFLNGIQPHHDEMLLVLLDEMNLARIEYYFSDFLSRLEQRNAAGFEEGNPKSRARAQVLLEAPNALGGMEDLPLLVGSNVLLVGTMNEDESTMSLSDKVLDRANVLRFGRPSRLQSATKTGTGKPANDYLNRKNWLEWCATSKATNERSKELDQIKKWTDRLNDCLHKSNRAFAHRTAGAIQAYCLAYPRLQVRKGDNTMDPLSMAFADQIEQRVMPKLRGLDCGSPMGAETIDSLLELVGELEDEVLRKALEDGRDANDGHSFVWSGVSRES